MAYKTQRNCVYDVLRENEDVSTLDVDIVIEEKEDIEQLLREKPDIEGILGEQNARSIIEDAMKSPSVHTNNTPCHSVGEQTCFSCAKKCILKSGHDIVKGMHLVYGRYFPLAKVNDKINKVLHSASEIFGVEQPFLYEHHAIVSEVLETSSETATVRLVEFTSVGSYTFKVIESDTPIVIDVESDTHISYKKYTEARYSPDIIVSRARSRIGDDSYRLFTHNCEHIAVWCVSGEEQSFQANNTSDKMLIPIFSWIDSVIGIIKPSRFLRIAAIPVGFIFAMISSILFILIDLICCILKLIRITKEMSSGLICKACYNKRKTYLVVKIICAVVGSVALFMTPATGSIAMIFLGILFVLVTAFILPSIVFFFYRKIKKSLNPLYDIPKKVVRKNDDINPGDVLTIPTDHDIIVKNVKVLPRNNNSWLHLEIVHFAWNGLLRTVEKELISFELDKNMLNVFEFSSSAVYSDEEVVDRALKKVGDTNFSTFFYRSSHMSKFCKVRNYREDYWMSFNEIQSTEHKVKAVTDVKPGDMINFRYFGLPHVGIVVGKLPVADLVEIEFYHVEGGITSCGKGDFDLDTHKILRHLYYDEDRFPFEETLEKAEEKIGKIVYQYRFYKSSRLAKDCVLKTGN